MNEARVGARPAVPERPSAVGQNGAPPPAARPSVTTLPETPRIQRCPVCGILCELTLHGRGVLALVDIGVPHMGRTAQQVLGSHACTRSHINPRHQPSARTRQETGRGGLIADR